MFLYLPNKSSCKGNGSFEKTCSLEHLFSTVLCSVISEFTSKALNDRIWQNQKYTVELNGDVSGNKESPSSLLSSAHACEQEWGKESCVFLGKGPFRFLLIWHLEVQLC